MAGEEADVEKFTFTKPTLLHTDMPLSMQNFAFQTTFDAIGANKIEKDQAASIKRAFEAKFSGTWQVVIGRSFAASVCNETGYVVFFRMDKSNVLIFQSLDEDAPPRDRA
jgi:dynein light chain LC8-type